MGRLEGRYEGVQREMGISIVFRKSYHSILMQALVDSKCLFRDVVIGWPGSVHDAGCCPTQSFIIVDTMGNFLIPASKNQYLVLISPL